MRPLSETFYETLLTACRAVYGGNLVSLAVFGSWAQATATPQSDIDLLVVALELPDGRGRRCRQFDPVDEATHAARAALWGANVPVPVLSPVFKTPSEVEAGSPLFLGMTDHIILRFDKNDFLQEYLHGLRSRMKQLGTTRRWYMGGYYWDYKPDFRPGEVVTL